MAGGERCTSPLVFPKRPYNRPALPRVGYRIGSYSDFREHLMRRLDAVPELSHWTHREPDDPGIALLECGAVLGDILTFYQELYANEVFLRTASWRSSVAELVRLVGYRLAPGLGGRATFAFELRPGAPVTVPAGFSLQVELEGLDEPATFETRADAIAHPELSRFNLHRPLTEPQLRKGATWLWIESDQPVELAPDDRLLLATPNSIFPDRLTATQIVVVEQVGALHGATIVGIQGALQHDYPSGTVAYRLGRSFRHFGHNAPPQDVRVENGRAVATEVQYCRSVAGLSKLGSRSLAARDVPIDTAVDDFPAGREVVCSYLGCFAVAEDTVMWGGLLFLIATGSAEAAGSAIGFVDASPFSGIGAIVAGTPPASETVVRTVTSVSAASLQVGSLTGSATILGLDGALSSAPTAGADIRTFAIHELTSSRMRVHARPIDRNAATGRELYFHGPEATAKLLAGRRLLLERPGGEALTTVVTAVTRNASPVPGLIDMHRVTLAADVQYADFPQVPDEASTTVLGNLVDADQGTTEEEVAVGSGDNRSVFQTFKLPQAPLTYHHAASLTPPRAPELEVAVSGRTWTRVESLFEHGPDAEVYIVREDNDGGSWLQFGDGARFGARLPSGVDNVTARARSGAGAHGSLKPDTRVQAGQLERLDAVQLPGVVSGGADPEQPDVARAAAPGRVRSLDRLVGLSDFESEALAIPGVALAGALWRLVDGVPTVTVTVLMEGGREQEHAAVAASLRTAARERGPDRFEIEVLQGGFLDIRLDAEVAVETGLDPVDVLAAVRNALGAEQQGGARPADGLFSLPRRRFGEAEHASRVTGVMQNVPGVASARVVRFGAAGAPPAPPDLLRPLACPADRVLRLLDTESRRHLQLTATAAGGGSA